MDIKEQILPLKIKVEGIEEFKCQLELIEENIDRIINKYEKLMEKVNFNISNN